MRPPIPWLLASLLAMRALVPMGYMLHDAAAGDPLALAFTMSLCPLQNPGLDLSLMATAGAPRGHAGHHSAHHGLHHATGDDDRSGPEVRGFADNCTAWGGSAVALAAVRVPNTPHPGPEMLALTASRGIVLATDRTRIHPARAPPLAHI